MDIRRVGVSATVFKMSISIIIRKIAAIDMLFGKFRIRSFDI